MRDAGLAKQRLQRHRKEMIDRRQHDEEREPKTQAPGDQLLLDRQQWLDRDGAQFFAQTGLGILRHDELLIVVHFSSRVFFEVLIFSWRAAV
jgi:hypothetical protein